MSSYYRVCKQLNEKGILVPEGHDLEKYKNSEAYISTFKYNEDHKKTFDKTGSVKGMTDVTTDIIYFDLDNKDIEQARQDTIEVIDRIKAKGVTNHVVSISGGKGFHIAIHTTQEFTPETARNLAVNIAGDLDSFDSSIYNANRIIRIEGSVHKKTGLRKTRISEQELREAQIDDIRALAKEQYEYTKPTKETLTKSFMKLSEAKKKEDKPVKIDILNGVDYDSNPYKLQPQKLAISQGFFPDGERSNALMILGTTLKNKHLTETQCYYALKAAADDQSNRYGAEKFSKKEIYKNIIEQIYAPSWNGGCYAEDNFPTKLQSYFEELGIPKKVESDLVSERYKPTKLGDVGADFEDFVLNYDKNVIKTGIGPLDKDIPLTPGMNLGIIGAPGAGKTAMALMMLEHCSKNNIHCILASIDMHSTRLYEKVLYRVTGLEREELYEKFKNGEAEDIKEKVRELFKTTYIYDKSAATIEDLAKYHKAIEAQDGVEIKMTMVDYFERVNSDVADDTASSKKVAGQWQDYINDSNVAGVMFVQPSKAGLSGGPNAPILDYRAIKGSSFLYQSFRGIISLWRPFYTPDNAMYDNYMQMALLKNDLGKLCTYDFGWNGKKGQISELDEAQKKHFRNLLEAEAEEDDI